MPLMKRATPEEKAAQEQQKERERQEAARKQMRVDLFKSPNGLARVAFETGDHVFQYSIDVYLPMFMRLLLANLDDGQVWRSCATA
jgi:hypothetical protein